MRIFRLILALALGGMILYFGNRQVSIGQTSLPPLAKFMDPYNGFWQNAEHTSQYKNSDIDLTGLSGPAEIIFDDRNVPHIYAQNLKDALYVQGYIEAKQRLWQMDFTALSGAGRLSEVLGSNTLNFDRFRRRFGLPFAAKNAVEGWKKFPQQLNMLQSYAEGVNAFINSLDYNKYPLEFKLLDYGPEQWDAYKSALISKSMAYTLCSRASDIEATNMINYMGREAFDFVFPENNPLQKPIIPKEKIWEFTHDLTDYDSISTSIKDLLYYKQEEKPDPGIGSNNWAVAAEKTKNGNPILCSDPHLGLSLPSVWMEIHIQTPEFSSYGVTIPGIPGIMIGFNENIAWGETNVGHDVLDYFKMEWTDNRKTKYLLDGEERAVEYLVEEIKVKGDNTFIDSIKMTSWGPILYDEESKNSDDLAIKWIAHLTPENHELTTFVDLMMAKNYDDYEEALAPFISPAQNFIFASKENDIAIVVNGMLPEKVKEEGRFVRPGNLSKYDWDSFIPRDEIPRIKNPDRQFVASANQHSTAPDYPHYYLGQFEDYRSRTIVEKLSSKNDWDIEAMKEMQYDAFNMKAKDILPTMLENIEVSALDQNGKELFDLLKNWDYQYRGEKIAPTIFNIWYSILYNSIWDDLIPKQESFDILYPESWRTIELIKTDPSHSYFDVVATMDIVENAGDLIRSSFSKAQEEFNANVNSGTIKWSDFRPVNIRHLLRLPAFSANNIKTDGHGDAINATKSSFGPSWRMIVELGDETEAYGVYPGGQSGNPGSPFYRNMVGDWANGKYHELNFVKSPDQFGDKSLYKIKISPIEE